MTYGNLASPSSGRVRRSGVAGGPQSANLADILERVLDKGLVIAGDIQVNLLDIELLTIKLRLVIASLDTARQVGINWWENDPWLNAEAGRRPVRGKKTGRGELAGGREAVDGDGERDGIAKVPEEIWRMYGRVN